MSSRCYAKESLKSEDSIPRVRESHLQHSSFPISFFIFNEPLS
uniref:Uncharacterized protein n=1 Tax=Utricularia reniformis TaxID=192314 RepID=A0A1Y0B3B9_9LAMI|nr:hypothetical protein AEK19_MT1745 [Utricularia reniformis]ART31922.1 hypothetical protein AEK19_MT1745 [Utricularia reniformis]